MHGLSASSSILWSKIKQSLKNSFSENPAQIDTEFSTLFNGDVNVKNEKLSGQSSEISDPKKVKNSFHYCHLYCRFLKLYSIECLRERKYLGYIRDLGNIISEIRQFEAEI